MGSRTQIGLPHALSVPLHDALNQMQPSYAAGAAVVLYRAVTATNHHATCTLCHVNSHYYTEKYSVIKGSQLCFPVLQQACNLHTHAYTQNTTIRAKKGTTYQLLYVYTCTIAAEYYNVDMTQGN